MWRYYIGIFTLILYIARCLGLGYSFFVNPIEIITYIHYGAINTECTLQIGTFSDWFYPLWVPISFDPTKQYEKNKITIKLSLIHPSNPTNTLSKIIQTRNYQSPTKIDRIKRYPANIEAHRKTKNPIMQIPTRGCFLLTLDTINHYLN